MGQVHLRHDYAVHTDKNHNTAYAVHSCYPRFYPCPTVGAPRGSSISCLAVGDDTNPEYGENDIRPITSLQIDKVWEIDWDKEVHFMSIASYLFVIQPINHLVICTVIFCFNDLFS